MNEKGEHYGGPFPISISPKMRVTELRKVIRVSVAREQCWQAAASVGLLPG